MGRQSLFLHCCKRSSWNENLLKRPYQMRWGGGWVVVYVHNENLLPFSPNFPIPINGWPLFNAFNAKLPVFLLSAPAPTSETYVDMHDSVPIRPLKVYMYYRRKFIAAYGRRKRRKGAARECSKNTSCRIGRVRGRKWKLHSFDSEPKNWLWNGEWVSNIVRPLITDTRRVLIIINYVMIYIYLAAYMYIPVRTT